MEIKLSNHNYGVIILLFHNVRAYPRPVVLERVFLATRNYQVFVCYEIQLDLIFLVSTRN